MLFSIIIPSWNRQAETLRLLDAIAPYQAANPDLFEVIVVDYGTKIMGQYNPWSHTISVTDHPYENRPGRSAAHARNIGAALATSEWLVFLDCDLAPTAQCLPALINHMRFEVAPNVLYGGIRYRCSPNGSPIGQDPASLDNKMAYSYCHVIHSEKFKELGGYNEGFYGWGGEDVDLCHRALKMGMDIRFIQLVQFYHPWHPEMSWKLEQPATPNPVKEDGFTMIQEATQFELDRNKYLQRVAELESLNGDLMKELGEKQRQLDEQQATINKLVEVSPELAPLAKKEEPQPAPAKKVSWWRRVFGWVKEAEEHKDEIKEVLHDVGEVVDAVKKR